MRYSHWGQTGEGWRGILCSGVPPSPWFCFSWFRSTRIHKYKVENSRNKQVISFRLRAILTSVINSMAYSSFLPGESPLCLGSPRHRQSLSSHFGFQIAWYCSAYVWETIILLNNGPKDKNSDDGNLDTPKKSRKLCHRCVWRRKISICRVWYSPQFQASTGGSWDVSSADKERQLSIFATFFLSF